MIGKNMQEALNKQINAELYAAYLYLSMSANFESANLPGFATWMRAQAKEEVGHAMRIYNFVVERLGKVVLTGIEGPPAQWDSPLVAFEDAFKHEQKVTGMIDELVALAEAEKDNASATFLQWFVTEQVEEESSVDEVVQKLKLAGDAPSALLVLDGLLGQRGKE